MNLAGLDEMIQIGFNLEGFDGCPLGLPSLTQQFVLIPDTD